MMTVIAGYLDERMNPIVVKEVRQAVRSRFVTATLMLFLIAQLFMLGIFLLARSDVQQNFYAGRSVFLFLQGTLLATCLFFVPLYVGARLAAERLDSNADLLFITTLRPSSIIWGKWLAGCLIAMVIFSACAPFMVLTYLLRGVDLPSIGLVLGMDVLLMVVAIQLAILLACIPVSGVFKIILGLVLLWMLGTGFVMGMGGASSMVYFGVGSAAGSWAFWGPVLAMVAIALTVMGLMFMLSVAMLTPPTANRALPVRLYLMGAWLVTGAVVAALEWSQGLRGEVVETWAFIWLMLLCVGMLAAVSERERLGPRLRRWIPRRPWLRPGAMLLYSGGAGGLLFMCLMLAATLAVVRGLLAWQPSGMRIKNLDTFLSTMSIVGLYALAYALAGMLIRRYLMGGRVQTTGTAALALMLMAAGALLPPLVMFLLSPDNWDRGDKLWLLGNPLGVVTDADNPVFRRRFWWIGSIACLILVPLSLPWLIEQVRAFKPLEPDGAQDESGTAADAEASSAACAELGSA